MELRPSGFSILPKTVKYLIIANVVLFLATIFFDSVLHIDIAEYLALHHWKSPKFKVWQLLTHMFMHGNVSGPNADYQGGFMHLFFNMFALWMFGNILENKMGEKRFLTFYILCGLGAAICHLAVLSYEFSSMQNLFSVFYNDPSVAQFDLLLKNKFGSSIPKPLQDLLEQWQNDPSSDSLKNYSIALLNDYNSQKINEATVGASGAVFGILFAFGYIFPNLIIYLNFFIPVKAKYFVAIYAAIELFFGIRNSAGDNVAHFAHLGGMLAAFIILTSWKIRQEKNY